MTTLLFFTREDLRELQDPSLAAQAASWQGAVVSAFGRWLAGGALLSEEAGVVELREWLRAVGAVESRAFGFRADDDGRELRAYVPFLCCANYQPGAPTLHLLRGTAGPSEQEQEEQEQEQEQEARPQADADTRAQPAAHLDPGAHVKDGSKERQANERQPTADLVALRLPSRPAAFGAATAVEGPGGNQGQGQGQGPGLWPQDHQQVYIDYGKKDNRALVEQYGFVLYGNPYDRIDWSGLQLPAGCRMRRDWVHLAAEELAAEAETEAAEAEAEAARAADAAEAASAAEARPGATLRGGKVGVGSGANPGGGRRPLRDDGVLFPELGPQGGAAAARARLRCAAASIVGEVGWRNLRERRSVTAASEALAVAALSGCVESQLAAFPTTATQDAELLLLPLLTPEQRRRQRAERAVWNAQQEDDDGEEGGEEEEQARGPGKAAGAVNRECGVTEGQVGIEHPTGDGRDPLRPGGADSVERTREVTSRRGGGGCGDSGGSAGGAAGAGAAPTPAPTPLSAVRRAADAVGHCPARLRLALSYRLERKLLLLAARCLLRRLAEDLRRRGADGGS